MHLTVTRVGDTAPDRGVVVILHGLFGSGRNWSAIAKRLARDGWGVVMPDLRNHGQSPWDATMTYPAMAEDLRILLDDVSPARPAVVIGHSMGGKAAMRLALESPERLGALVVVDVAPVAYRHDLRDLAEAMRALPLRGLRRRAEADAALADAVPEAAVRAFLLQNLDLPDDGPPRWRPNLDGLIDGMPDITGWPPPPAGARYDGPTLVLSGAASDYVRPAHAEVFSALFPGVRAETVDGAGHWVHAERPEAFLTAVGRFLETVSLPPA
ncbi:alpha/beta fold hydrolase [Roseospira visakhapatnamensis]|uniref:Pimeloyl-ACP methyl ester carboxylesterase n=1 Tax=Roseospira visakhapatnamensis TaxID=390880 RepID=A0A7W6REE8_9PROT|nr:alpha/beta fold hydrolase [Roseospira visakhapatnamensis]MBB4266787.1 pimeloyl-ACP methyl ester carboxylesterase [Roseospira visakhapatnamensis]